ncbi:MAG TPA: glycosyltransferase [Coriobacteriia bacterium]|nr:glycosyltransferase [Coriobacteriia bacterium]
MRAGMKLFDRYRAEQGRPDILHAHSTLMGGVLAARISHMTGVPYVVTEHSSLYGRDALRSWQLDKARQALAGSRARIVVSPQLGRALEARLGQAACPWIWVPNLVDAAFLAVPLRTTGQSEPFRFLNVALLSENKGHVHLLEAFARAFGGSRDVELRIGGDGPMRRTLEKTAERLGISESVRFLGRLDRHRVLEEVVEADVFVLSSLVETFGVVLVEALACGTPVIATRSGGPECIVQPGDGLLVEPGQPGELAVAMLQMYRDVSGFEPAAIRERCRARFSEDSVVASLEAIYHEATLGRVVRA